jgi:hypothetical protein
MTLKGRADPRRAARYYSGSLSRRPSSSDEVPAMLWLWVSIVALARLRSGEGFSPASFSASEVAVYGGAAGVIVVLGRFLPRAALLVLVALLVAGVLGAAPVVADAIAAAQSRVSDALQPLGGSGGNNRK